ncbi:MAG: hypothetical protein IJV40_15380 [Oscillospiraceae bacterium]|nr:hypothetical protein [Oscillospiraceae bacterium]
MSDYKDFVGNILNKAKDLAGSEAIGGAVEKVKDAAASTGITDVIEKGTQRARSFGTATRNTLDLNREHRELERVFAEIGKLYYEQAQSTAEGFFVPLFEQVTALQDTIAAKEAEIEAYRASFGTAPAEAGETGLESRIDDFESIVNQTENDGAAR